MTPSTGAVMEHGPEIVFVPAGEINSRFQKAIDAVRKIWLQELKTSGKTEEEAVDILKHRPAPFSGMG